MKDQIRPALTLLLILTVLTGLVYPFTVTGLAQLLFPHEANGSLIVRDGKIIGSELIGQYFDAPSIFGDGLLRPPRFPTMPPHPPARS